MSNELLDGVSVIYQSAVRIAREGKVIYFDPYKILENKNDADVIFITHDHSDHFSPKDIDKVRKADTKLVVPEKMAKQAAKLGIASEDFMAVTPGKQYDVCDISFETIPAYNKLKPFHPKKSGWTGYLVNLGGVRYYIAGDTDATNENKQVRCDVAFVPIGGTYTMNPKEAAELVNCIRPKVAVPTHYGCIVGKKEDADEFGKALDSGISCKILLSFLTS